MVDLRTPHTRFVNISKRPKRERKSGGEQRERNEPTKTAATPPAPPEMKDLIPEADFSATFSSFDLMRSGLSEGVDEEEEEEEDCEKAV